MYTQISLIIGNPDETNFIQVITSPSLKHGNFENRTLLSKNWPKIFLQYNFRYDMINCMFSNANAGTLFATHRVIRTSCELV